MQPDHEPNAETTVADLVEARPEARAILRRHGIDLCCGGSLTLAEAAEVRGVDVATILADLGAGGPAAAAAPSIGPSVSVRAVLARFPQTAAVFAKHGLGGCGGAAGPDERIDFFAGVHRVDVGALLRDLRDAAARPADPPPAGTMVATTPGVYRRFLVAALVATLTLGAVFGAYNLIALHLALGPVPPAHHSSHAGAQIWGFVLLFVMGVSLHAVPRFFGTELRRTGAARAAFALAVGGLVLVTWGRAGALLPATAPAFALGGALLFAAIVSWAAALADVVLRAKGPRDPFVRFLAAGTAGWIAAAALLAASGADAVVHGDADRASAWNEAIYAAALLGGTLAWVEGMFLRIGPAMLALAPTRDGLVRAAFWSGQAGAVLATAGAAMAQRSAAARFAYDAGLFAVAVSVALFAAGVRPFSTRPLRVAGAGDGDFVRIVRLAFAFAWLFAVVGAGWAAADVAGLGPPRLVHDAARHAFALGFVTLAIFGVAGRVLPVFGGTDLRWPALRRAGAWLIAAGAVGRQAQAAAAILAAPGLLAVSGASGIVAAAGVVLASASILGTLAARPSADAATATRPVEIGPDANVAALVASHPETLPVLVGAGFAPLANPILRRTIARAVTLRQACRMHGVDLDDVVARLRAACPHGARPDDEGPAGDRRRLRLA